MENNVPAGRTIITRPEKQGMLWMEKLRLEGIECELISLLKINSFRHEIDSHEANVRAIKNVMLQLDLYQKIIFVSQNAVECGMEWIEEYWPQMPIRIDFFAIGKTTANLLREYGVAVQDLAEASQGDMTSESLLLSSRLQNIQGEKILIFRGIGGRGHLSDELSKRGAQVEHCEVYQRLIPSDAKIKLLQWIEQVDNSQPMLIAFHSGETLHTFQQLLVQITAETNLDLASLRNNMTLLVPSKRLEKEALDSGFTQCIVAMNATDEAMVLSIKHFWSEQRDR